MTNHIPEHDAPGDERILACVTCQDHLHELALGILPDHLTDSVIDHIDSCASCRAEFRRISRTTRLLPFLAEPTDPPSGVKELLFSRIAQADRADTQPPVILHNPWHDRDESPIDTTPDSSPNGLPTWQRWLAAGVIAPLAICLIVLSAWTNSLRNEVTELRDETPDVASISVPSTSPYDLQLYEFRPACENCPQEQASGKFGGNPNGNIGVVVAWNLDPNETHQVWCVNHQGEKLLITDLEVEGGNVFQTVNFPDVIGGYEQIYVARHNGSADPDAELLVAMNDQQQPEPVDSTPQSTGGE